MARKTDSNKERVSLGEIEDIQKRLESGGEISTQDKAKLEEAHKVITTCMATFNNDMDTAGEAVRSAVAPISRDIIRAERLVNVVNNFLANEESDPYFEKVQAEFDSGDPLTALQVIFLVMESRGMDIAAELARKAQLQNLAKGRKMASEKKGERATKYHAEWRQWAKETWVKNPFWDLDKVAEHVLSVATEQGHKMANKNPYRVRSIKDVIKGVRSLIKND